MIKAIIQRHCTTHDNNGNPRRYYAVHTEHSDCVPALQDRRSCAHNGWMRRTVYIDEGYDGRNAWLPYVQGLGIKPYQVADLGDTVTTPADYRETLRLNDAYHSGEQALQAHKEALKQ